MGFFKDLHTLTKQANEIQRNTDVGAQMAQASAMIADANTFLQQQAAAATLAGGGQPAGLQVIATRDTGTVVDLQPVVEVDLLVHPDGGVPYPATIRQLVPVSCVGRLVPGAMLRGKVDTAQAASVWIDWSA